MKICVQPQIRGGRITTPQYGVGLPFIQGPPGRDGVTPPSFPGFGQITYSHVTSTSDMFIDANQTVQLMFTPDTAPLDYLNGPFFGHQFWDGTKVVPRAMYDLMEVQVNLQFSSLVADGSVQAYIDANSPQGPIVSSTATLFAPTNTTERVTFILNFQVLSNVMTNGARVFLRSTVPANVVKETLLIMPRSTHTP